MHTVPNQSAPCFPGLAALLMTVLLHGGCGPSPFQTYYVPDSPGLTFPPVQQVRIYQVGERDPFEVARRLFPNARLLGSSRFTAPRGHLRTLEKFARSLGADVAIWHATWLGSSTQTDFTYIPETDTTTIITHDEQGKERRTVIREHYTRIEPRTTTTHRYRQIVLFLRTTDAEAKASTSPAGKSVADKPRRAGD